MAVDRSAVVIVVDSLPAGFLGAYGNAWLPTPTMDRLASQSMVVEFPWLDSLDDPSFSRGVFFGRHACCPDPQDSPGIGTLLRDEKIDSLLVTDDASFLSNPGISEFTDCELIAAEPPSHAASDIESTMTAQFLAVCAERLTRVDKRSLVWIQFHGLRDCWDAPLDLRTAWADETDPQPPQGVEPISRALNPDDDPDIALGAMQAFAAQIAVVDHCLAPLLAAMDQCMDPQRTLLLFTSSHGFALGEHGSIGKVAGRLYSELLHVPLIVRTPFSLRQPWRRRGFAQPADLFGTLADWFRLPGDRSGTGATSLLSDGSLPSRFSLAVTVTPESAALRVPAWFYVADPSGQSPDLVGRTNGNCRLYAKPDDRWDANDIATLCPDIVHQMREQLRAFQDAAAHHRLDQLSELPIELTQLHR